MLLHLKRGLMKDSKPTEFNQVSLPNVIHLIVTVIVLFVTAVNMDKMQRMHLKIVL